MASFLAQVVLALAASTTAAPTTSGANASPTGTEYASGFDMTSSWSNLSPYREAATFGLPKGVPRDCELSQVHVLHRHAQRYPGPYDNDGAGMEDFYHKLQNYTRDHDTETIGIGPLSFLNHWRYLLGLEVLLPTGAATEATSGAHFWSEYGRMLYHAPQAMSQWDPSLNKYPNGNERPKLIFRTTGQERILESARWWASGFFGDVDADPSYDQYDLVIMPEGHGINNSLAADHSCGGDLTPGLSGRAKFIPRFTKEAQSRLAEFLPNDFDLTTLDVNAMLNLCPYETATLGNSSFCALFTEQEWKDFAYSIDVQYYGGWGFGSPAGRAQGIGYVLELAARLQGQTITTSDTSINTTFDSDPAMFPLNQPLYLDMSHDNIISAVLTALGLEHFNYGPHGLPVEVDHAVDRKFRLSEITPFGSHLVSEIWTCPADTRFDVLDGTQYENPDLSEVDGTTEYIRFVLNGAPLPLDGNEGCSKAKNGFCVLDEFLHGVSKLKELADYPGVCFGRYKSPNGEMVADGRPPVGTT
ncbi:hypothetical protein FE257_000107 [Aspergillus nanangensis]|uniref:3-phytase n=1 Tax=Aspergillus nanangensis TaxID=2582783 RepID=A0AAD4CYR8_ASPNN|nr:hypothetical protein FE257_000107 [Aspergillus nanangensis]